MINLKKEEINKELQNAEEYRKMSFNVFVPLIEKAIKNKKTEIHINSYFSKGMKKYLKDKGFELYQYSNTISTRIRW
jgi:hypothetical protein